MSATDSLQDLRATFRCPVADTRRECALLVGDEKLPARLIDESAGGFAILVDRPVGLEVGQTALLQTDSGRFNVAIRSMAEYTPSEDDADGADEWSRIGLQRLGDAMPEEVVKLSPFAWLPFVRLRKRSSSDDSVALPGLFLAIVAVLVPIGLAALLWSFQGASSSRTSPSRNKSLPDFIPSGSSSSDADSGAPWWKSVLSHSENGRAGSDPNAESNLRNMVSRLPGPTALSIPEVVQRLNLTDEQQKLIRQIIDAMADELRKLGNKPPRGAGRDRFHEQRDKLFDEYRRQAVEVLTPEQQAQWQELRGVEPSP